MNIRNVTVIFKKQLIELLRDKRTIFVIFILPLLLYPIMVVGFAQMSIFLIGKMAKETYKIVIENHVQAPELFSLIEADSQFSVVQVENADSALQIGDIQLFIRIPDGFEKKIASGDSDTLRISFNGAKEISDLSLDRLNGLVNDYRREIVSRRIENAGLDSTLVKPVFERTENVASEEKMGGMVFGRILALILVLMVITGAYYPSVDMVAGEKERGTLETLLVSPVGRIEIVIGKYLTVFVLALVNALLNLASMGLTIGVGLKAMGGNEIMGKMAFSIDIGTMAIILLELLPLAALFSAIFLAISAFANSYKEAQGYLTPVFLAAELPAMAAILPGIELSQGLAFVPVMNVALLFKAMMVGDFDPALIITVWLSTAVYAALALRWATSILSNEESLLSETKVSPLTSLFSRGKKSYKTNGEAGPVDSFILYAIAIALLFLIGVPAQMSNLIRGLAITEIFLVLLPPFLFVKQMKLNIKSTFRLKAPRLSGLLVMIPLTISGFFLITQFQVVFFKVFGLPFEYIESMQGILNTFKGLGPILGFAAIALLPAICEEFLFRGYILDGLTRGWGPVAGIIVSGVLFGAFHMDPNRLVSASILGIIFAMMVWRGDSLFYGITGHLVNNGIAFAIFIIGETPFTSRFFGENYAPIWATFAMAVIFGSTFYYLWNRLPNNIHNNEINHIT